MLEHTHHATASSCFHVLFLHTLMMTGGLRTDFRAVSTDVQDQTANFVPTILQIFGSLFMNPVFKETSLTIACSD